MSVRGSNRNPGGRLGRLHEGVESSWGLWWGTGGQPQVGENFDDHRGIFYRRENGQRTAAPWAGGEVDGEDAFEQLRPTHASS